MCIRRQRSPLKIRRSDDGPVARASSGKFDSSSCPISQDNSRPRALKLFDDGFNDQSGIGDGFDGIGSGREIVRIGISGENHQSTQSNQIHIKLVERPRSGVMPAATPPVDGCAGSRCVPAPARPSAPSRQPVVRGKQACRGGWLSLLRSKVSRAQILGSQVQLVQRCFGHRIAASSDVEYATIQHRLALNRADQTGSLESTAQEW